MDGWLKPIQYSKYFSPASPYAQDVTNFALRKCYLALTAVGRGILLEISVRNQQEYIQDTFTDKPLDCMEEQRATLWNLSLRQSDFVNN